MLEVKDLTRVYGRGDAAHVAVEGVEFQVAEGELVSIVGPSGCGKSTVLRCIAGLLAPTSGQVVLRGEPVDRVPDRLAVVFQEYGRSLYPWLTVRDNVALPLRQRQRQRNRAQLTRAQPNRPQLKRSQRRQTAEESLAAVGLTGVSARYPWQLSGGMQQRVARQPPSPRSPRHRKSKSFIPNDPVPAPAPPLPLVTRGSSITISII